MKAHIRTRVVAIVGGLVTAAALGLGGIAAAQSRGLLPLRTVNNQVWAYGAARTPAGGIEAHVDYRHATAADLRDYADANRLLATSIARDGGLAEVLVTFRSTLSTDEFRTWARGASLIVSAASVRTVQADGLRSTVEVFPPNPTSDPLPQGILDGQVATSSQAVGPLRVQGVFAARGRVDASRLPALLSDSRVFLVDVTPTAVRRDLVASGIRDGASADVTVMPAFWWMENIGLATFR